LRMNMSSEVTWINAARSGPTTPIAASAIPTASKGACEILPDDAPRSSRQD
jgi:hypothetical protein